MAIDTSSLLQAAGSPGTVSGLPAGTSPLLQTAILGGIYGGGGAGVSTSANQSQSRSQSGSYIPNYSETPILENIANYSASMAPQVYQWGMQQYTNNQGNINSLMRNALTYASPQRIASDMGMAESGAAQGAEKGRQSALSDLQSYGIDPSAGRYAGLDQASRVMSGAATAGAGNQQRISDIATGNAMQQQAISSGLQNTQLGYGAANAANQFAGTAMNLKYSPLGQTSSGSSESSGYSLGAGGGGGGSSSAYPGFSSKQYIAPYTSSGMPTGAMAAGGPVGYQPGGDVSYADSPSNGAQTDDVNANLNAGEFVVPRDVAQWKGQEYFYKLMAQARKDRATVGTGGEKVGYGAN
jgi:hypothetical protein